MSICTYVGNERVQRTTSQRNSFILSIQPHQTQTGPLTQIKHRIKYSVEVIVSLSIRINSMTLIQ